MEVYLCGLVRILVMERGQLRHIFLLKVSNVKGWNIILILLKASFSVILLGGLMLLKLIWINFIKDLFLKGMI